LKLTLLHLALSALLLAPVAVSAQTPTQPSTQPPRTTILIDPAHGGSDSGAHVADRVIEKEVNFAIANRLRALLTARAFDVILTRNDDTNPAMDERASIGNTAHPLACIVLHSSGTGSGVHLFASALPAAAPVQSSKVPWDSIQSTYVTKSLKLENLLTTAMTRGRIPVSASRAWVQPLDSMLCPAIAIEVAPLKGIASTTNPDDEGYQQRIAATIASALLTWKQQTDAQQPAPTAGGTHP